MSETPDQGSILTTKNGPHSNIHCCVICRYQTKSSFKIAHHIERHHTNATPPPPFDCVTSTPETYHCTSCNFKTYLLLNFKKHVNPKSLLDITEMCEVFTCKSCNFQTHSQLVFLKHTYDKCIVDEEKTSDHKVKVYSSKHSDYLKCHRFLKCIPYDIGWLKCEHCSYQAKMKGDLKKHMTAYHTIHQRIRWFECEQCLFNVKQIFHLREHLLTEHIENVQCFDY